MTRAICSTAAAAALMVVAMGAQAAVETLTFGFGFEALRRRLENLGAIVVVEL